MTAQLCEWFALCDREAEFDVAHPILGSVPTCARCVEVRGLGIAATPRLEFFGAVATDCEVCDQPFVGPPYPFTIDDWGRARWPQYLPDVCSSECADEWIDRQLER